MRAGWRQRRRAAGGLLAAVAALSATASVEAADGAIEISQVGVLAGGLTPGDAPGFPATLDAPGSYVLTSNLVTPSNGLSAIRVLANDVHIDLNGFALIGPRTCTGSGATISCTGAQNSVSGVRGETVDRVSVRNGTVRGFWRGVWLAEQCRVEEVIAFNNSGIGLVCGPKGALVHNVSFQNQGTGLNAGEHGVVRENVSGGNGFRGIRSVDGSTAIERNVTGGNAQNGISCDAGCTISRNVSTRNTLHGIHATDGAIVSGNVACENDGNQLNLGSSSGYTDNVLVDLRPGALAPVSGGVFLDPNVCNGSVDPADCAAAP